MAPARIVARARSTSLTEKIEDGQRLGFVCETAWLVRGLVVDGWIDGGVSNEVRSMDVLEQTTSSTDRNSRLVSYDL